MDQPSSSSTTTTALGRHQPCSSSPATHPRPLPSRARVCPGQSLKGVSGDVIILEVCASPHRPMGPSRSSPSHPSSPTWQEAAYCDPGLVSEVVCVDTSSNPPQPPMLLTLQPSAFRVPLLSMQQSVLLCISTILDSGNHYSKMMEVCAPHAPRVDT